MGFAIRLSEESAAMLSPEKYEHLSVHSQDTVKLELLSSITPRAFLEFAKADLSAGSDRRNLSNAVSNAKRALHYQTDVVAVALGVEHAEKRYRGNFPGKVEFLSGCGVVSSRLLRKLNVLRNALEHDYEIPSADGAEMFVDVVELFLAATERLVFNFPVEISLTDNPPPGERCNAFIWSIDFRPSSGSMRLCTSHPEDAFPDLQDFEREECEAERKRFGLPPSEHYSSGLPNVSHKRAFRRAMDRWRESSCERVPVTDEAAYFGWMSFLLRKTAEHNIRYSGD